MDYRGLQAGREWSRPRRRYAGLLRGPEESGRCRVMTSCGLERLSAKRAFYQVGWSVIVR